MLSWTARNWARIVPMPRLPEAITLVDVGASDGVQRKWARHKRDVRAVLFEPNPAQAAALRKGLGGYAGAVVVDTALSDREETHRLNIAKWYGCTSVLQANMSFLRDYAIAESYQSSEAIEISCMRYDALVAAGAAPRPDVIKIDIEGFESRALAGFGDLLHEVIGIETEAWFYPAYHGQALLHEIADQLATFDLRLRRLEPVPGFADDLVCVNAYFTPTRQRIQRFDTVTWAKYKLMSRVWGLKVSRRLQPTYA